MAGALNVSELRRCCGGGGGEFDIGGFAIILEEKGGKVSLKPVFDRNGAKKAAGRPIRVF